MFFPIILSKLCIIIIHAIHLWYTIKTHKLSSAKNYLIHTVDTIKKKRIVHIHLILNSKANTTKHIQVFYTRVSVPCTEKNDNSGSICLFLFIVGIFFFKWGVHIFYEINGLWTVVFYCCLSCLI